MDQAKAQKLIAQLERHHQEQIQSLKALFGLASKDAAQQNLTAVGTAEEKDSGTKSKDTDAPSAGPALPASGHLGSSPGLRSRMPEGWAKPWSNELLRQRIRDRASEPGCGGSLWRDLSDVESTDPAAIYIAEHALNDLTRFTLARDRATDSYQKAFYVIDYDHRRQKVLDTRQWGAAGARASGNSAMLQRLFKQRTIEESLDRVIPFIQYKAESESHSYRKSGKPNLPDADWIQQNLSHIIYEWKEVLDALDVQTTLSSSVTFNTDARQEILFEDRNFSNSKRYFWALQSLRLFAEYIDGTLRIIPVVLQSARDFDDSPIGSMEPRDSPNRFITKYQESFGKIRDRIERKRQEVQGLSDGVSQNQVDKTKISFPYG
ncbi:MAG: hypothetical protein L6R36_008349 [Xanthoria steineri]|nr:MAG: hypothetical protein L6R36_008349 [Xanthoria steineri]